MDRRIAGTAAAIVLALAAASVWYVNSSIVPDESLPGAAATSGVPSGSAPFARSFAGTQPDGAVAAGNGELQLNPELLQRFDYYLAAVGERSVADIRAEIERDLQRELKPEAAARAKQILARYLDFKQALVQLERTPGINGQSLEAIRERLAAIKAVRSRYFTPLEMEALFGPADAQASQALERLAIQQNAALSAEQKAASLALLDARLTPEQRREREAPVQHLLLAAKVDAAKAQGANEAQIQQLRVETAGEAAAQRLAALDREEADWRQRISAYLAERARLLANTQLAEADRQTAVAQLRQQRFSELEQRRLGAYE